MKSDSGLAEVVKLLAEHKVLGAPVVDFKASEDASWIDRYIGIAEFAGVVVWILQQSAKMEGSTTFDYETMTEYEDGIGRAVAAAASGLSSARYKSLHLESPTARSEMYLDNSAGFHFWPCKSSTLS